MYRFANSLVILLVLCAVSMADSSYTFGHGMIEDTWIYGLNDSTKALNYGGATTLLVTGDTRTAIIMIRNITDSLPASVVVDSARLYLYAYEGCDALPNCTTGVQAWRGWKTGVIEGDSNGAAGGPGATWNTWDGEKEWGTAGAANASDDGEDNTGDGTGYDRKATIEDADTCWAEGETWLSLSISAAFVQERYDNGSANDDIILVLRRVVVPPSGAYPKLISTEYLFAPEQRPYFTVWYHLDEEEPTGLLYPFLNLLLGGSLGGGCVR